MRTILHVLSSIFTAQGTKLFCLNPLSSASVNNRRWEETYILSISSSLLMSIITGTFLTCIPHSFRISCKSASHQQNNKLCDFGTWIFFFFVVCFFLLKTCLFLMIEQDNPKVTETPNCGDVILNRDSIQNS